MIVEARDTKFDTVHRTTSDAGENLHLVGLVFHSALAVGKVETAVSGPEMRIDLHLTPGRKGFSGSFDLTLPLPPEVETVTFGPTRAVIWSREPGTDGD